jgi:hypothetical protein
MKFAQHFVGAQQVSATLNNADPLVDVFVFERNRKLELALINKTDSSFTCTLSSDILAAPTLVLSGPAIDAKQGVELSSVRNLQFSKVATASPYTAVAFDLKGATTT